MKVKEGQDLNEVEEKCQCQKDHDVNGEKSVSCSIQITDVKRPFSSSQCGNTYKHKRSLKNHMRIHAGIKPFCCSQCGKSFTKKSYLKDHLLTHTSKKPFTCSQCGHTFTRKESLKNHMLIHAGIKPFTCSQCGRVLQLKGNLRIICIFTLQKTLLAALSVESLSHVKKALRITC